MTLFLVLLLAAAAVVLSPVAVFFLDRKAGWPLAALYVAAFAVLARQLDGIHQGQPLTISKPWIRNFAGWGVDVNYSFRADSLSAFFALLALGVGAVVFVYSAAYLPKKRGNQSFYLIMSAFMLSVLLLILANDVAVLFISWELVSIGSFLLIARAGSGGEKGAVRTLLLTFSGGLLLLTALALTVALTGSTTLSTIVTSSAWADNPRMTTAIAVIMAFAAFTKAAQLPFHFWLPEAMAAATPVSAFLHAAAVVKAGVYLLMRFSTVFHDNHTWNVLLICVGMTTAVMASLFAIQKTDLKKLTAYSTVSHLGWIVATVGVGTPFALAAAAVHVLAHGMFKSSLFMLIGVIDHQAGTRDVRRLGQLYNRLPFTFVGVVLGALSMAAVPPMLGFVSKEGMLEAFEQAPLPNWGVVVLLLAAGVGALLTFTYSARLVLGAFVDGPRDMSGVKEAPVSLWLPAALPSIAALPLVAFVGRLDGPIDALVTAVVPESPEVHLALWHGVSVPLLISVVVLVLGVVGVWQRHRVLALVDGRNFLPRTGNELLNVLVRYCARWGKLVGSMANSYSPSRHLLFPVLTVLALGAVTLFAPGIDGMDVGPRVAGIDRPIDLLPLVIVAFAVTGLVRTTSRLVGVVLLGVAGVGVTLQILALGAPDVALTQFLVELLVVVIMMMVVRYQPRQFHRTSNLRQGLSGLVALAVGVISFAAVMGLIGHHDRPEIAMWYLENGPEITGGDNVVNTILVEFRALDTMGELSVLGMAGVVIAAVTNSMPRHPFRKGTNPPRFGNEYVNSIPMRQLGRVLIPVLGVLSVFIFMRGHQDPGGGFIAALVAGAAFFIAYLSKPEDVPVLKGRRPALLTGVGVVLALISGFIGLAHGSFLYAYHFHIGSEHFSSAMLFDLGVFLSVLGMLSMAINRLGGPTRPGADRSLLPFVRGEGNPFRDRQRQAQDRVKA